MAYGLFLTRCINLDKETMNLIRLIYSSRAELDLRLSDVQEILHTARTNNRSQNVCGMLFYNSRYFLQALEGEEQNVKALYAKIAEDFRHDDLNVVSEVNITEPIFSDWTMGYSGNSQAVSETLHKLRIDNDDLTLLNGEQCLLLLKSIVQQQALAPS